MVGSPHPFGALSSLSSDPPVPTAAQWDTFSETGSVTFDQALQPGVLDTANWRFRVANNIRPVVSAIAAGAVISFVTSGFSPSLGPTGVSYDPPPFDVLNLFGRPTVAFTDFPLVVT